MEGYRPETILLATDGSADGGLAAVAAVDLSKRTGAKLHPAHAWVPVSQFAHPSLVPARYHPPHEEGARRILDEQLESVEQVGDTVSGAHLVEGRPTDAILYLAERIGADLIVVGSRGLSSTKRLLVGSVSLGVVHHADRPVLVVRGRSARRSTSPAGRSPRPSWSLPTGERCACWRCPSPTTSCHGQCEEEDQLCFARPNNDLRLLRLRLAL